MPTQGRSGKPTTRRYSDEEKARAVRLVRQLRAELGTEHGTVRRVADQLGYGTESVRSWVRQADIELPPVWRTSSLRRQWSCREGCPDAQVGGALDFQRRFSVPPRRSRARSRRPTASTGGGRGDEGAGTVGTTNTFGSRAGHFMRAP